MCFYAIIAVLQVMILQKDLGSSQNCIHAWTNIVAVDSIRYQ